MAAIAFASTNGAIKWGGSEHLWVDVAARLIKQGHHVTVCVRKWPELDGHILALKTAGATVTTWPRPTLLRKVLRKAKIDRSSMELGEFDVLVVNCGGTTDLLGNKPLQQTMVSTRRRGTPYVVAIHSTGEHFVPYAHRVMLRDFLGHSAAVILPASRLRGDIERFIAGSLPQCVTLPTPTPLIAGTALRFPELDVLRMATVGRLYVTQKGQDLLLAALAKVSWRNEAWTLDLYGDGGDERYVRDLVTMFGLEDHVSLKGVTDDLRGVWETHHVLLMPSRMEARGIAITEAMACGRAVVGSAIGGIPETVLDGDTGILATSATVEGWVVALERLWRERESLASWGANGRKILDEMFAVDVVDSMADVIVAAAEGRSSQIVEGTPITAG